jgi:hypothetical protein
MREARHRQCESCPFHFSWPFTSGCSVGSRTSDLPALARDQGVPSVPPLVRGTVGHLEQVHNRKVHDWWAVRRPELAVDACRAQL